MPKRFCKDLVKEEKDSCALSKRIKSNKLGSPKSFDNTIPIKLLKSGSPQDLGNSKFINMKEGLAKITESRVVMGMKEDIIEGSTKHQIGG